MAENQALIEKTVKQVMAILGESRTYPRTGRMQTGIATVDENATISSIIDYTRLVTQTTARQVEMLCFEAMKYGFKTVCVNSVYVPLASELLKDSEVGVCTVVGFPLGACLPQVKAYEAQQAIKAGVQEIDVVCHIGALKSRDLIELHEDISDVAVACHEAENGVLCKVIIETSMLTEVEKIIACQIAKSAGADFVKTSTGFSDSGATSADVDLMRAVVGDAMGVEAAGGIRTLAEAQALVAAGANRIGTSAGIAIAQAERGNLISNPESDD